MRATGADGLETGGPANVAKDRAGLDPVAIVEGLYQGLLGRGTDPGAAWKSQKLASGEVTLAVLIQGILESAEYQARRPGPAGLFNDQTQFGELELLMKQWIDRAAPRPVVVDVGARGRARSNSFDLMETFDWKGLLIEANPALAESIRHEFKGLDYALEECAVSDYEGEGEFYIGINEDVSSLNVDASRSWGPIQGTVAVAIRRLAPLLEKHDVPLDFGLLSIDIEGEDIKVFNDLLENSLFRPRWVVIEASYDFATRSLDDLPLGEVARRDYALVGQTSANLILEYRAA